MKNVNIQTKKKQIAIVVAVVVLGLCGGGAAWYLTASKRQVSSPPPGEPAPDMTGVVNATFDDKVQQNTITEVQRVGKEVNEKIKSLEREIKALSDNNVSLQKQLNDVQQTSSSHVQTMDGNREAGDHGNANAVGVPADKTIQGSATAPMQEGQSNYRYDGMGNVPPGQIMIAPREEGLRRQTFTQQAAAPAFSFPYIPSGSYAESVVIEGADANAAVTGSQNTSPMQLRLTGKVQMPNDRDYDLTGCFVTLEAYGDVSSERAEVRTRKLSCNIGKDVIDQKIEGHVSFMGKNGIKGEVVMRNGKVLGFAWGAGFLSGIGKGIESAGSTTVGVGATASPGAGDIMKSGIGGGTSEAAKTLSEYYIKRAEQYHPVIPIGAGNEVTLVFNDGFQIQTIAEILRAKQKRSQPVLDKTVNAVSNETQNTVNDIKKFNLGDIVSADGINGPLAIPGGTNK
ncbi:F-type conjugal transfer pilus assembly protein TraB (plasmid) [Pantoea agglomerans]|uniref:F-type conjugal transfer pilus assembly protein TraB n=1 Tax=Enterobacter agglomerans TaxID=549 RepID=UPI001783A4AA|nr:F-type conjugal transfer pilus assembly protein TraB [Pantoea agglomerans]